MNTDRKNKQNTRWERRSPTRLLTCALLLCVLFCESGCVSCLRRVTWNDVKMGSPGTPKPPYSGVIENVVASTRAVDATFTESPFFIFGTVFTLLSLPFDVAADTICLPYDLYSYFSDKSDIRFWEDVFSRNDTSLPLEEYKSHFSTVGRHHARNLLDWDEQGYREIERKVKNGKWAEEKISYPQNKISPEMRELFDKIHEERLAEWLAALDAKRAKSTPPPVEPQKPEATHE